MDTYDEHSPLNPINEIEVEAEIIESAIEILEAKLKTQTERLNYKTYQLKRIAEIEQILSIFGKLTFEELKEKQEILNQYL